METTIPRPATLPANAATVPCFMAITEVTRREEGRVLELGTVLLLDAGLVVWLDGPDHTTFNVLRSDTVHQYHGEWKELTDG